MAVFMNFSKAELYVNISLPTCDLLQLEMTMLRAVIVLSLPLYFLISSLEEALHQHAHLYYCMYIILLGFILVSLLSWMQKPVGQMFKREVHIQNLPPLYRPPKLKAAPVDSLSASSEDQVLVALFGTEWKNRCPTELQEQEGSSPLWRTKSEDLSTSRDRMVSHSWTRCSWSVLWMR